MLAARGAEDVALRRSAREIGTHDGMEPIWNIFFNSRPDDEFERGRLNSAVARVESLRAGLFPLILHR
jgi:hypothetical protein